LENRHVNKMIILNNLIVRLLIYSQSNFQMIFAKKMAKLIGKNY